MLLENESFPEDCRVLLEAQSLRASGYEVTVICPRDDNKLGYENVDGVHVYRYPAPLQISGFLGQVQELVYSLLMLALGTVFVFFRRGFDAIHVHAPPDLDALIPVCFQLFGKKFVHDVHDLSPELYQAQRNQQGSELVSRALQGLERLAVRRANRIITTNQTQREILIQRCAADPKRFFVVRNGVDQSFLKDVQPHSRLRGTGKAIIGFVGVIGVQDGVENLIKAARALRDRGRTDFLCVVIGSGAAWEGIQSLTHQLGLDDYVQFVGRIPYVEVPPYIAAFDICVTPDHSNPYNDSCTTIKTMEYMALGKPTVCFQTNENIVTAGDAALYASNNDPVQLADRIEQLMDNAHLRQQLGQLAQTRVWEGLTWKHQEQQLIALYDGLFQIQREASTSTNLRQLVS